MLSISHPSKIIEASVDLPASKSISNRLLIIHFLMNQSFRINHLSECDDTVNLQKALKIVNQSIHENGNSTTIVDVGEAGTSFRFLTAMLAITPGNYLLTGSKRLLERPILPLVNALKQLGANISIENNNQSSGLLITGTSMQGGAIELAADISSQFMSALMLIAPYFKNGLSITLKGKTVSAAYLQMTKKLMQQFNANVAIESHLIQVKQQGYTYQSKSYTVESDWTAASYWYAFALLSKQCNIELRGLYEKSLQGDKLVAALFCGYGIKSTFESAGVKITKSKASGCVSAYDFIDNPDLVQTFAFMHAALGYDLQVNHAGNLIHKETNRIAALAFELKKIGVSVVLNDQDDFKIVAHDSLIPSSIVFETYLDHRMAMAAAIIAMKNSIKISNEGVVAKSYPDFWNHLIAAGFQVESIM